jgi:peptidyl-prolyl cis-trans isomerase D
MVLQKIRDRLSGFLAVVFFSFLIIPFAFVGVSSYFSSDTVNNVAMVNDQGISISEFNQSFQNYRRQMQSFMGARFDPEEFDQPIIRRQHLDSLIDQELLAQVSAESGLSVDDDRLALTIRDVSSFHVDGEFNADVYQARLQAQGSTPQQFENDMRARIILNQYPATITGSAIATKWELEQYVRLQEQERAFGAIIVPAATEEPEEEVSDDDAIADGAETDENSADDDEAEVTEAEQAIDAAAEDTGVVIEEEAVLAWYEAHADDYRSEEQVIVEYLELDAATMAGVVIEVDPQADEADIETARQQAEELAVRAMDGEDFAALASEFSNDSGSASVGGDLGWVEPGFMVQAFEDGLYELTQENPISKPVQTGFGWHVIQLREIRPSEGMSFAEASVILEEEYRTEAEERRFLEQADLLIDVIYEDPTTLDAAAEVLSLAVQEAGPFGRAGGAGIAANAAVVKAAFSDLVLLQGSVSDPVDLDTNHLVMVRLKEHLPETQLPLEEVRDQVVAAVRHERAMEAASETAQSLLAQLAEGGELTELASTEGFEVVASEAAKRTSADIAPDLREQLFLLDVPLEGEVVTQVVPINNGFAVVRLSGVTDGVLSEDLALRAESYLRRISNASASAETIGFLRMLRSQSQIEVFEDRL